MLADDGYLVERLRTGDDTAFEELVNHHAGPLLAVTRRILRNEEEARDAVQETFVAAFRGISAFQSESRVSTWLHRIAVNCALMKLRIRVRREADVDALLPHFRPDGHQDHSSVSWSESAEEILQREQSCALVRQCIDQLPEPYRVVLVLRDIEQLPADVVAEKLQITRDNLKVKLHRARQALRTLLDPHMRGAAL
ncbi:MAG: sigma-70 family RNA polymerase sigma factor [Acidobacteria bacterium]|nr:sigma-70 family RNA polymerase sigma factor [Acidobacteriota bacterium]MBV9070922.1 sigma-70 family RNA polymerase sigma factor [Acidobacteriota bacterium]MBV9185240.1 sigma-70 family RNA polymerase sigma factor [Acidobacteriota bacterium]